MRLRNVLQLAGCGLLLVGAMGSSAKADLIVNGGFETGDFTGWTTGGNIEDTSVQSNDGGYLPHSGNYFCYFGAVGSDETLSQTVADVSGDPYTLSFWVSGNGTGYSDVNVYWNGALQTMIGSPVPNQPYTEYSVNVTGTGTDTVEFGLRNDPSYDALDDVSLNGAAAAVPLPKSASTGMALLGGLGLVGFLKKRRALTA